MKNRVIVFIGLLMLCVLNFFMSFSYEWSTRVLIVLVVIWWMAFVLSKKYQEWQELTTIWDSVKKLFSKGEEKE